MTGSIADVWNWLIHVPNLGWVVFWSVTAFVVIFFLIVLKGFADAVS